MFNKIIVISVRFVLSSRNNFKTNYLKLKIYGDIKQFKSLLFIYLYTSFEQVLLYARYRPLLNYSNRETYL